MLFNGALDNVLYPMTADIYYAEEIQEDYGNMSRKWVFDRTINCSAITIKSDKSISGDISIKDRIIENDSALNMRTNEDIRKSSSGKYMPMTSIAVTNFKDSNGDPTWINTENLRTREGTTQTKYEVKTVIPSFDMFHKIGMYRVFLLRSAAQKWESFI